jgi:hypothetical protein
MRKLAVSLVLLLSVAIGGIAQNKPEDKQSRCVGTWAVDLAASDYGTTPPPKSAALRVTKCSADAVAYTYSEVGADGKKFQETWSGKPDGQMLPAKTVPAMPTKNSFKWDGDVLVGEFDMCPEGTATEQNSFSEDGKTMTTKRTGKSPKGDYAITQVWHRKSGISSPKKPIGKPNAGKQ